MPISWQLDYGLPKGLTLCLILPGVVTVGLSFSTEINKSLSLLAAIVFLGGAFYLGLGENL
jgi:hypothetical protein